MLFWVVLFSISLNSKLSTWRSIWWEKKLLEQVTINPRLKLRTLSSMKWWMDVLTKMSLSPSECTWTEFNLLHHIRTSITDFLLNIQSILLLLMKRTEDILNKWKSLSIGNQLMHDYIYQNIESFFKNFIKSFKNRIYIWRDIFIRHLFKIMIFSLKSTIFDRNNPLHSVSPLKIISSFELNILYLWNIKLVQNICRISFIIINDTFTNSQYFDWCNTNWIIVCRCFMPESETTFFTYLSHSGKKSCMKRIMDSHVKNSTFCCNLL